MLAFRLPLLFGVAAAFALTVAAHGSEQRSYTVVDVGTLGGTSSAPIAINDRGDIAGESQMPGDGDRHAFLYRDGRLEDIGVSPLLDPRRSRATGLNNRGEVVPTTGLTFARRAFVYR